MANPRLKRHGEKVKIVRCKCGHLRLNRFARGGDPGRVRVVEQLRPHKSKIHTAQKCEVARG